MKVEKIYQSYKRAKLKEIEQEIAMLIAKEKALLRKLLPLQEKIAKAKQEKVRLQKKL